MNKATLYAFLIIIPIILNIFLIYDINMKKDRITILTNELESYREKYDNKIDSNFYFMVTAKYGTETEICVYRKKNTFAIDTLSINYNFIPSIEYKYKIGQRFKLIETTDNFEHE